jgi:acetyl esterase/lipase
MIELRGARVPLPACAALVSPWADLSVSGESAKPGVVNDPTVAVETLQVMASCYIGNDTKNPGASPLFADARGLPPLLLMAGEREVLRDDAVRLAQWARSADVDAELFTSPDMVHIWPVIAPAAPEAAEAVERIRRFFSAHGVA